MASRRSDLKIYAVEVQPELADLADTNVHQNQLQDRIDVLCTDMKLLTLKMTSGPFDLIVSNPPYHKPGSGRINPDAQRAVARHEIKASLVDVLQTTRRYASHGRPVCNNFYGRAYDRYPIANAK